MEFKEQIQEKKEKIVEFLIDFDTREYDQYKQIVCRGDDILEHSLCDDDKCAEITKKNLRKDLPKYTRLTVVRYDNDYDHEKFETCNVCGKFLNKYLCYYEDELNYLIKEITTKEELIEDTNAFKVVGLLESVDWLAESLNSDKAKVKLIDFVEKIYLWLPKN